MPIAVLCSGGLDSAVLVADAGAGSRTCSRSTSRSGLAWEAGGAGRRCAGWPRRRPSPGASRPLARLELHDARRLPGVALGHSRHAAGVRHAGRGRLSGRPQHHPAVEGGGATARAPGSTASPSARWRATRSRTRRRSSSARWVSALSLGLDHRDGNRGAVRRAAQGGRGEARRAAGRAAGADAVVHEPAAAGVHCGPCSKCRERRDAFDEAGVPDRTDYAAPSPR